jgi:NADH-quinone oxidoreductase subunit C
VISQEDRMADEPKPEGSEPVAEKPEPPKPPAEKPAAAKPAAPAAKAPAAGAHAPPKPPPPMAATPWESDLAKQIKERFGDEILECSTYLGQNFVVCKLDSAIPLLEFLKLEADFDYLVDLTAVDYPKRAARFDLFYILYSFARNERIRIKTAVADGEKAPTVTTVHATANWLEREVFDMFGVQFSGHPDMRRILLPEEWEGFPLRKEYGLIQQDDRWVRENLNIESGQ